MLTEEALQKRKDELLAADLAAPRQYWWLSFCDPERPKSSKFLGATIVVAGGIVEAMYEARLHGCNPGGEIQGVSLCYVDDCAKPDQVAFMLNTLRSKTEMEALGII